LICKNTAIGEELQRAVLNLNKRENTEKSGNLNKLDITKENTLIEDGTNWTAARAAWKAEGETNVAFTTEYYKPQCQKLQRREGGKIMMNYRPT
jgi:hypothetical protein